MALRLVSIVASFIGLILTGYDWLAASFKASALIGVTDNVAKDYLQHLHNDGWSALGSFTAFACVLVCSLISVRRVRTNAYGG